MEQFYCLLLAMGISNGEEDTGIKPFDILTILPLEISFVIMRMLDPHSLLSGAMVSKKWLHLIKLDPVLRSRVRQQIIKEKKIHYHPFRVTVIRDSLQEPQYMTPMNGAHKLIVSPVSAFVRPDPPRNQFTPVARQFTVTVKGNRIQRLSTAPRNKAVKSASSSGKTARPLVRLRI